MSNRNNLLRVIIFFSGLFIFCQLLFLGIHLSTKSLELITRSALNPDIFTHILFWPFIGLFASQFIIYSLYIYFAWYVMKNIQEFFFLTGAKLRFSTGLFCVFSLGAIFFANMYFVSHSFFATITAFSKTQIEFLFILFAFLSFVIITLALVWMVRQLIQQENIIRHGFFLTFVMLIIVSDQVNFTTIANVHAGTLNKPDIILIGFDALRPDYLNENTTPNFTAFLQSAVVFKHTYAPLARTFPALTSILTGKYPINHRAREDNLAIESLDLQYTLPTILREQGYQTIFASDDNRFSYINKEFGFDHVVGDKGDIRDYVLNVVNDFPLSNLIIPTQWGRFLFPYNYANHAAAITHHPDNFLQLIKEALGKRENKPLFLQVHFNVTAWPFYHFNTHEVGTLSEYKHAVATADALLGKFLATLKTQGLLDHAILVVLSDHGITLAKLGERITRYDTYQGDKQNIHLQRTKYINIKNEINLSDVQQGKDSVSLNIINGKVPPILNMNNYGIDTSFGYGSDVLSLLQNHALLAIKTYGLPELPPHEVSGYATLMDIAPTILDMQKAQTMQTADGVSLKKYLYNTALSLPIDRSIFLESGYSVPEIQRDGILVDRVVAKAIGLYQVDRDTGLISMQPGAVKASIANKQRALMRGDWLLAYYPSMIRYRANTRKFTPYIAEPYQVLVNLKSGLWTVEMNGDFARIAPLAEMRQQMRDFYKDEMKHYH